MTHLKVRLINLQELIDNKKLLRIMLALTYCKYNTAAWKTYNTLSACLNSKSISVLVLVHGISSLNITNLTPVIYKLL